MKKKMRWVMLQAGCVWYFRDQSRKEQLGMMPLVGSQVEGATASNTLASQSVDGAIPIRDRVGRDTKRVEPRAPPTGLGGSRP